jgi:mono/diheme cytochrome c family protein
MTTSGMRATTPRTHPRRAGSPTSPRVAGLPCCPAVTRPTLLRSTGRQHASRAEVTRSRAAAQGSSGRTGPRLIVVPVIALLLAMVVAACGDDDSSAPDGGGAPDVALGEQVYAENCASCHGADLRGTDSGPSPLSQVYEPGHHSDESFRRAIAEGVAPHHWRFGPMPPVSGLDDDEVEAVIAYVRSVQEREGFEPYPPPGA